MAAQKKNIEIYLKNINTRTIPLSKNNNDIITHHIMNTFNLRVSTIRLFRYYVGKYAISGVIEESLFGMSKRSDYSYRVLRESRDELLRIRMLELGSDGKYYLHPALLRGDSEATLAVTVRIGVHIVPDR